MPEFLSSYGTPDARDLILEAALTVFAKSGFDGTTMRQIGQAASVSAGLIHHHFKDKETLWRTVGQRITQDFREQVKRDLPADSSVVDEHTIAHLVGAYMAYWKAHPAALRFQLWRVLGAPDDERKARSRELNEAYVPVFAQAQRAGYVRSDVSAGQAMVTTGALIQFWLHSKLEATDAISVTGAAIPDDDAFLNYVLSLILTTAEKPMSPNAANAGTPPNVRIFTLFDVADFPLVRPRTQGQPPGFGATWAAEMDVLISDAQPFVVLVDEQQEPEAAKDRATKARWLKANKIALAAQCLGFVMVEADPARREALTQQGATLAKAFGLTFHVVASAGQGEATARELVARHAQN